MPGNPSSSKHAFTKMMDARIKPGHDEWCLPRHLDSRHNFAISPRVSRELFTYFPPSPNRGRRESRMPIAPAVVRTKAHEWTTGSTGSLRLSLRSGLRLYVLLCPQNLPECANGRFSPTARRWI